MSSNRLTVPGLDGPSDTRSQGHGSQAGGSPAGSKAGSRAGGSQSGRSRSGSTGQKTSPFPPGIGFDPALDDPNQNKEVLNKRLDLPADAFGKVK